MWQVIQVDATNMYHNDFYDAWVVEASTKLKALQLVLEDEYSRPFPLSEVREIYKSGYRDEDGWLSCNFYVDKIKKLGGTECIT